MPLVREYELELRIVGSLLTARLDGQTLISIDDTALTEGGIGVGPVPEGERAAIITRFEYLDLGAAPTPTAQGAAVAQPLQSTTKPNAPPEPAAIKLWDTKAKVRERRGGSKAGSQMGWADQSLFLNNWGAKAEVELKNLILRAAVRMNADAKTPHLLLRYRNATPDGNPDADSACKIIVRTNSQMLSFVTTVAGKPMKSRDFPLPRAYTADEYVRVEVTARDDDFTVAADGKLIGTVHDETVREAGGIQIYANANGYFRDIEYVPLDGGAATGK